MKRELERINFPLILIYVLLIALAIAPNIALGEGRRNLFLIGLMYVSPLVVFFYYGFYREEPILLLFMGTIIVFPLVHHPESMRWSTVFFSIMFCLTYMAYRRLLSHSIFTIEQFHRLIRLLIFAYFIVLLIQQFCVLTGLPVFNQTGTFKDEPWKLNSLAAEPSHSARIMALLMYCFISVQEVIKKRKYNLQKDFREDKWVWLGFVWTMVTMGSGTAFLFIPVVLLMFLRIRNLIPLFIVFGIIVFVINLFEVTAFERTYKTVVATVSLDNKAIIEADRSASFRIVPMIVLTKMIDLSTLDSWFGHGIDYVSTFMYKFLDTGIKDFAGGGLLTTAIDYGFITVILFIAFSFNLCYENRYKVISIIFWFLLVFMSGINSQICWFTIIFLYTAKYFKKVHGYANK